jgi:hypothetical protein
MDDFYWKKRVSAVLKNLSKAAEIGSTDSTQVSDEEGAAFAEAACGTLDESTDEVVDLAGTEILEHLDVETLRRHFAVMPVNSEAHTGGALDDTTAALVAVTTDDDVAEVKRKHAIALSDRKLVVETLWRLARRRVAAVWRLAGEGALLAQGGRVPPNSAVPLPWVEEPEWLEVQGRLASWSNVTTGKYMLLELETHCRARSYARALQVTFKMLKASRNSTEGILAGTSKDSTGNESIAIPASVIMAVRAALFARLRWVSSAQDVAEESEAASGSDEPDGPVSSVAQEGSQVEAPLLSPHTVWHELINRMSRPRMAAAVAIDKRAV